MMKRVLARVSWAQTKTFGVWVLVMALLAGSTLPGEAKPGKGKHTIRPIYAHVQCFNGICTRGKHRGDRAWDRHQRSALESVLRELRRSGGGYPAVIPVSGTLPPGMHNRAMRGQPLPPGIRKQLMRGYVMPVDVRRGVHPLSGALHRDVIRGLGYPPNSRLRAGLLGNDLVVYNPQNGIVANVLQDFMLGRF